MFLSWQSITLTVDCFLLYSSFSFLFSPLCHFQLWLLLWDFLNRPNISLSYTIYMILLKLSHLLKLFELSVIIQMLWEVSLFQTFINSLTNNVISVVSPFIKWGWKCLRGELDFDEHCHGFIENASPVSPQPTLYTHTCSCVTLVKLFNFSGLNY